MSRKRRQTFSGCLILLLWTAVPAQGEEYQSHLDEELNYPIRVVEAQPRWQPGTRLGAEGNFKMVFEEQGTVSAERVRLPVPESTWRLDGRVGRTRNGTIFAAFGTYLYGSKDEGKNWRGKLLQRLPGTRGERVTAQAFGVAGDSIYLAHASTVSPGFLRKGSDPSIHFESNKVYPLVVSHSSDGGLSWESSALLNPGPYKFLAGDGNSIIGLDDGTLLAAFDAIDPDADHGKGSGAQLFFRSTDRGKTWGRFSEISQTAAETGLLSLGGKRVLAAIRVVGGSPSHKTVRLADSDDGGRTWKNLRPLTTVNGQAHCDLARLPGDGVVAVYENRYPYPEGDVRAQVSWDNGKTWERELYLLVKGAGYAGSVAGRDGTIITVAGDGQLGSDGKPIGRGYTLQALRWKPRPRVQVKR